MAPSLRLAALCSFGAALALSGCTCAPPVVSAAAAFPCLLDSDCVEGWRCGDDGLCSADDAPRADDAGAARHDDAGEVRRDAGTLDAGLQNDGGAPPPVDAGAAGEDGGTQASDGGGPVHDGGDTFDAGDIDAGALDAGVGELADAGPMPDAGPPVAWWDASFRRRIPIVVDATSLQDTLPHFPVLIRPHLAAGFAFGDSLPSGADLRVVDDDGNGLDFDIERWSADDTALWVRVPNLEGERLHRGWLYYGKSDAASDEDKAAVWSPSGHRLVLHSSVPQDASGNSTSFSTTNIDVDDGLAGGAIGLHDELSRFEIGDNGQLAFGGDFTVDGWLKLTAPFDGTGPTAALLSRALPGGPSLGVFLVGAGFGSGAAAGTLALRLEDDELGYSASPPRTWQAGEWVHFAFVVDSGDLSNNDLYLDGALVASTHGGDEEPAVDLDWGDADLELGNATLDSSNGGGRARFYGSLDEVRLSSGKRSAAWIRMQVAVMRGLLVHHGAVEPAP